MSDFVYAYSVGDVVCAPSPDGIVFDVTDSGSVLVVKLGMPTASEKAAFASGEKHFGFAVVDDIIFFLSKFGDMPWMDAPFARQFSSCTKLEMPDKGFGLSMHAMLIDASTGILVAQKLIGLPTNLSRHLVQAIMDQPEIQNYSARLAYAMQSYSTQSLVARAEVYSC